jgi:hypothetical protein
VNIPDGVSALERDLREIFGPRLQSLVALSRGKRDRPGATLAVVDALTADDLRACAERVAAWHDAGLRRRFFSPQEFGRSLDAFPLEFGAISPITW